MTTKTEKPSKTSHQAKANTFQRQEAAGINMATYLLDEPQYNRLERVASCMTLINDLVDASSNEKFLLNLLSLGHFMALMNDEMNRVLCNDDLLNSHAFNRVAHQNEVTV